MDIFGSRWQGYTELLTRGWNSVVSPDDTVVVAGDISWGMTLEEAAPDLEFLSALNGQKLILKGNHDFWWQSQKKIDTLFAEKGIDNIKPLHNNAYAVGAGGSVTRKPRRRTPTRKKYRQGRSSAPNSA